jgi:hypothetical protein
MLITDQDPEGCAMYTVCNDQGLCLIRTSDRQIAEYVDRHSRGIDHSLRLTVGGDPGTHRGAAPLWQYIRRVGDHR